MSVDFYTLRKKGISVYGMNGKHETVYFLQLVIRNALSPDAQEVIDRAIKHAFDEWESVPKLPGYVVQIGSSGIMEAGCPIFEWSRNRRVYCFDDELLEPFGYLGERKQGGFLFRTVREQRYLNDLATARKIDEGGASVYKDFWAGETFKSGSEFLAYRRGGNGNGRRRNQWNESSRQGVSPKLSKIVHLIRLIESKGNGASSADLHFLVCLKNKALELGYCFQ